MDKISFRKANEEKNWDAFDQCHCDSLCCGCAHKNECRCSDYISSDDYDSNRSDEVISRCAYFTTELTKEYWKAEMLDAYNSYTACEFNSEPIEAWPEDGVIGLAYTTYEFEEKYFFEHEVQVNFDLNDMKFKGYIDDVLVYEETWTAQDFIDSMGSDFDSMIYDTVRRGCSMGDEGFLEDDVLTEEIYNRYKAS